MILQLTLCFDDLNGKYAGVCVFVFPSRSNVAVCHHIWMGGCHGIDLGTPGGKNEGNRVFGPSPWSNSQTPAIGTGEIDRNSHFSMKSPVFLLLTCQWNCEFHRTL